MSALYWALSLLCSASFSWCSRYFSRLNRSSSPSSPSTVSTGISSSPTAVCFSTLSQMGWNGQGNVALSHFMSSARPLPSAAVIAPSTPAPRALIPARVVSVSVMICTTTRPNVGRPNPAPGLPSFRVRYFGYSFSPTANRPMILAGSSNPSRAATIYPSCWSAYVSLNARPLRKNASNRSLDRHLPSVMTISPFSSIGPDAFTMNTSPMSSSEPAATPSLPIGMRALNCIWP